MLFLSTHFRLLCATLWRPLLILGTRGTQNVLFGILVNQGCQSKKLATGTLHAQKPVGGSGPNQTLHTGSLPPTGQVIGGGGKNLDP